MLKFSASVNLMWRELPLEARFGAAREAGFSGVELQSFEGHSPEVLAQAAREAGVQVALMNLSMGDLLQGGYGLAGVPGRESLFADAVAEGIAAAGLLGCRHVHLGPSRIPPEAGREQCMKALLGNITAALPAFEQAGLLALIEPVNVRDIPGALLDDFEVAADLVQRFGVSRLGLQFDIYHAAMMGLDPVAILGRHHALVRHVQFSDAPGRHQPGTGEIDFAAVFIALERAGYSGWAGAEYVPAGATADSLGWLDEPGIGRR